jgi:lipoprotein-anchoring transpeptidase ErfK/SrfK
VRPAACLLLASTVRSGAWVPSPERPVGRAAKTPSSSAADPAHARAVLLPGPNNTLGVVWIGISQEHYGRHGTPKPGRIGHVTSHGCVRLTNWDASRLASLVDRGTRVVFEE